MNVGASVILEATRVSTLVPARCGGRSSGGLLGTSRAAPSTRALLELMCMGGLPSAAPPKSSAVFPPGILFAEVYYSVAALRETWEPGSSSRSPTMCAVAAPASTRLPPWSGTTRIQFASSSRRRGVVMILGCCMVAEQY